jgi:hypothetical protein
MQGVHGAMWALPEALKTLSPSTDVARMSSVARCEAHLSASHLTIRTSGRHIEGLCPRDTPIRAAERADYWSLVHGWRVARVILARHGLNEVP